MSDFILFDYDMFGRLDNENNIQTFNNADALINSIRIWFSSRAGDRLRNPNNGGFLDFQIAKLMDKDSLSSLRNRIAKALENDFNNIFEVNSIILNPLNDRRTLEIDLNISCKQLNADFNVNMKIKNGVV